MNYSLYTSIIKTLIIFFVSFYMQAEPQEGKDFERIPEGLITDEGITEIFGYWCPACYSFENTVQEMKERKPDIVINQVPAGGEMLARLYYTIQAMGLGDEGHMNVYKDWQVGRKSFRTSNDMREFAKRNGYDDEKFMSLFNSFSVGIKANNATRLVNNLSNSGIFVGVPTVVINGKYKLNRGRDTEVNIQNMFFLYDK